MARIPKFQRQRLASSVVGTPGVDTSSVDIAHSIADTAQNFANLSGEVLVARRRAQDTADATEQITALNHEFSQALDDHKQTNQTDPTDKNQVFRQNLNSILQNRLGAITRDPVRQMVSQKAQAMMTDRLFKEAEWAQGQQLQNIETKITNSINTSATTAVGAGRRADIQQYNELIDNIPNILQAGEMALGAEEQANLKGLAPQSITKGFMYGLLDKFPEQALDLLRAGTFDKIFSDEEGRKTLRQFTKDAEARLKKINEVIDFDNLLTGIDENQGIWDSYRKEELTLDTLDEMEQTPFIKQMREMVLKAHPADVQSKAKTEVQLWDSYNALRINKKKTKAKAHLEDIMRFQKQVIDARMRGEISDERVNFFMKNLAVPLTNKIKQESGRLSVVEKIKGFFGATRNPLDRGYEIIHNYLVNTKQQDDTESKAQMLEELVQQYDQLTEEDFKKDPQIMDRVTNSIIGFVEGKPAQTPVGMKKVVGFNGPGDPIFDFTPEEVKQLRELGFAE